MKEGKATAKQKDDIYISRDYKIRHWKELELSPDSDDERWKTATKILRDRLNSRYLDAADLLVEAQKEEKRASFGFAILALDCLVIETVQGFKHGVEDHQRKSGCLIKAFLREWPELKTSLEVSGENLKALYENLRCAVLHSGQTDGITVDRCGPMVEKRDTGRFHINRNKFHDGVKERFEGYLNDLCEGEDKGLRANFIAKMKYICAKA